MSLVTAVWSFALVGGLLVLIPGLDTALILRTAVLGRRRQSWGVVAGIQTGTLAWGALTSLGLSSLLTASRVAYDMLRWAGALYLLWMGASMLIGSFRRGSSDGVEPADLRTASFRGGLRQGAITNLLNPKIGVFYVAVLPQFIPADAPHLATGLLLTTVHVMLGLSWSCVLVLFASRLSGWLRGPWARRLLDRVTGTVIVTFGARLAAGD